MKKVIGSILLTALIFPSLLHAGREEGVMNEFRALEEALRTDKRTPEERKKTLEANLLRGMQQAIIRMFYQKREELLKNMTGDTIKYENPTSELVYYVKYQNFIIRFDFARDPEIYNQAPVLKKVLIKPEGLQMHSEPAAAPAGK